MTNAKSRPAPLPPEAYWKPEWFEAEQRTLFRDSWLLAGIKQDLANHNDYISTTVATVPIIVRNMRGELIAFHNICSHRHSLIHAKGKGNAPFRCMFHGWMYGPDGVPVAIPDNDRAFQFEKSDRETLALKRVAVESCGNFVFVRLAPEGLSLKEFLGPLFPRLEAITTRFDILYGKHEATWACNWKPGIEVTLEAYHLPYVHAGSLANHIGNPQNLPTAIVGPDEPYGHTDYFGLHSTTISAMSKTSTDQLSMIANGLRLQRNELISAYDHYFIYPNLMLSVSGDAVACAELYEPIGPGQTAVTWWLTTSRPEDPSICGSPDWNYAMTELSNWTKTVMSEDHIVCEGVQIGVRHAEKHGCLGVPEERIHHLQQNILDALNAENPTKTATLARIA
ncbi:MAG TPA: aromatic ring-hydroxylating dioxygenase subunit alpha [Alphaproteobacteria bacterium]|nr:aromatic ring-hydroxylating dioxygenase subunit alpha [Alphaproteobacteria bacterium]